jgi:hypothetical protein
VPRPNPLASGSAQEVAYLLPRKTLGAPPRVRVGGALHYNRTRLGLVSLIPLTFGISTAFTCTTSPCIRDILRRISAYDAQPSFARVRGCSKEGGASELVKRKPVETPS